MPLNTNNGALVAPQSVPTSSSAGPLLQPGQSAFNPIAPISFGVPSTPATATKTVVTAAPAVADLQAKQANVDAAATALATPKPTTGNLTPEQQASMNAGSIAAANAQNAQTAQQTTQTPTSTQTPAVSPAPNGSTTSQILNLVSGGGVSLTTDQVKQIAGTDFTGFQQNPGGTWTADPAAVARVEQQNNFVPTPTTDNTAQVQAYITQQQQSLDNQAVTNYNSYTSSLQSIANGSFPLTSSQQSQLNALQQSFDTLKAQQLIANQNYTGAITNLGIRSGRSRYAPEIEQGQIQGAINLGLSKIANIDSQASTAIANLQQGFADNNYKLINAQYSALQDLMKEKDASLQTMAQNVKDQVAMQTSKLQNQKTLMDIETNTIDNVAKAAFTDALNPDGSINHDAIQKTAYQYGVDVNQLYNSVLKQQDAYKLQQQQDQKFSTDQLQAKATLANTQATTAKTKADTAKTYQDIANAAPISPNDAAAKAALDPNSQSILAQTGLSVAAFNYLTQGTAALSRLSSADRQKIMNEAGTFLNSKGLDYSTFQSQYKAQNDVVQKNIERAANTKIFGGEVSGTANQFIQDIGGEITSLKPANVAALFATGQINDPTTQKYAFDLQTMQNDLAGYYAASRGAPSPDQADLSAAANVITNGLNGKGAKAFKDSIDANVAKVSGVVNEAVTGAQQSVWNQFGVGDKYKAPETQTTGTSTLPADTQTAIKNNLTFSDDGKTAYLPRSVWSALPPNQYDAILAESQKDGVNLLIQ